MHIYIREDKKAPSPCPLINIVKCHSDSKTEQDSDSSCASKRSNSSCRIRTIKSNKCIFYSSSQQKVTGGNMLPCECRTERCMSAEIIKMKAIKSSNTSPFHIEIFPTKSITNTELLSARMSKKKVAISEFVPFSTKYSTKFLDEDCSNKATKLNKELRTLQISHSRKNILPLDKSALSKREKAVPIICKQSITLKPISTHIQSVSNLALAYNGKPKHLVFK